MSKSSKSGASLGTVSGVIGKGFVDKPQVSNDGSKSKPKPVKLYSDDIPESELWDDHRKDSEGVDEFLFKMLGEGFSLDKSEIIEILRHCGFDVTKGFDELMHLSEPMLEKGSVYTDDHVHVHENPSMASTSADLKQKHDLEKEVLNSLFSLTVKPEEDNPTLIPVFRRSSSYWRPVEEPRTTIEYRSVIRRKEVAENAEDKTYEGLRKAVKEYWGLMREYYRAAVEAFANGDGEKADKLMKEGHFYMVKAREADEESAEKLLESDDEDDELTLDLLDFEPKEAIRFLKVQLNTFCGTVKHLKLRVKGDEDNGVKVGPLKRFVAKFLQREGIEWTEEGDGSIFAILLDKVDRSKLSFAKK